MSDPQILPRSVTGGPAVLSPLWKAVSMKGTDMRVFVAGATGAIGKQLVPRLVAAGHEVHGMTRSESKQAMLDELGAVPVVADALDPDQVAQAIVLRYGALCGPGTSMAPGEEQFELV